MLAAQSDPVRPMLDPADVHNVIAAMQEILRQTVEGYERRLKALEGERNGLTQALRDVVARGKRETAEEVVTGGVQGARDPSPSSEG